MLMKKERKEKKKGGGGGGGLLKDFKFHTFDWSFSSHVAAVNRLIMSLIW